ncbi:hypothetical protein OGAPHI_006620 [Ogataea philodendri]|uniref:Uncharacterized protein n=1 Tax=Ogataea philodendri TaxID=1378263 RepID=A0A9P8NWL9_9ASCO|nr:uncharacterized protein OGAPHI_006620 [Ogataea philodendri]KAH3661213.1 hypothetical protein OGAPHI_006620 [Ogataea philodendri]
MAWTVSCNDPSPINRMHLRFGSISSSANWAPTADGSEYPMDPHNTCEMAVTLDGKWVWITPNEEVPVSVTITSPDLRKYDSFFHR